jgi:hypothetical protein
MGLSFVWDGPAGQMGSHFATLGELDYNTVVSAN